jgi:hypothetical protein
METKMKTFNNKAVVAEVGGLVIVAEVGQWSGWFGVHDPRVTEYVVGGRRDWPVTQIANCASLASAKKTARRLSVVQ